MLFEHFLYINEGMSDISWASFRPIYIDMHGTNQELEINPSKFSHSDEDEFILM